MPGPSMALEAIPGLGAQPQQAAAGDNMGDPPMGANVPGRQPRPKREPKQLAAKDLAAKALKDGNKHMQELKAIRLKLQSSETLCLSIRSDHVQFYFWVFC